MKRAGAGRGSGSAGGGGGRITTRRRPRLGKPQAAAGVAIYRGGGSHAVRGRGVEQAGSGVLSENAGVDWRMYLINRKDTETKS